jgi:hypothetical protein
VIQWCRVVAVFWVDEWLLKVKRLEIFFGGSREFFVYGFEFENLLCYTG